jgi:nicotinamide mononucleotide transporter
MKSFTTLKNYFSKTELILWSTSVVLILIAFCLFDRTSYMTL